MHGQRRYAGKNVGDAGGGATRTQKAAKKREIGGAKSTGTFLYSIFRRRSVGLAGMVMLTASVSFLEHLAHECEFERGSSGRFVKCVSCIEVGQSR